MKKPLQMFWTAKEHENFVSALKKHGKDYSLIQKAVATKSRLQVSSYAF